MLSALSILLLTQADVQFSLFKGCEAWLPRQNPPIYLHPTYGGSQVCPPPTTTNIDEQLFLTSADGQSGIGAILG